MPWCFSTRASVVTVLSMYPCTFSCLWVKWFARFLCWRVWYIPMPFNSHTQGNKVFAFLFGIPSTKHLTLTFSTGSTEQIAEFKFVSRTFSENDWTLQVWRKFWGWSCDSWLMILKQILEIDFHEHFLERNYCCVNGASGHGQINIGLAWCYKAPNHNLNQCWPHAMMSFGTTKTQRISKILGPVSI